MVTTGANLGTIFEVQKASSTVTELSPISESVLAPAARAAIFQPASAPDKKHRPRPLSCLLITNAGMPSLSDSPPELLLLIADCLPLSDVINLSSCSRLYRSCLAPVVCKTVAFGNDQDSASVALKAVQDHGNLVRKLVFSCGIRADIHEGCEYPPMSGLLPTDEEDDPDSDDDKYRTLLAATNTLLSGSLTPRASKLVIRIELEYWSVHHFDEFFEPVDYDVGGTLQAESKYGSRALMASVWDAVADNKNIRSLEVPSLMPKFVSSFETPKFKDFLGSLHEIDLSIFSAHGEDGFAMERGGYQHFLFGLEYLFFDHTCDLRHLRLECPPDAPLGLAEIDLSYIPLPFPVWPAMPRLNSLELSRCFICPELAAFIQYCQASLRSLRLNCVACPAFTWDTFFLELMECVTELTELVVDPWSPDSYDSHSELSQNQPFFTYAYLKDDAEGLVTDDTFAKSRGRQNRDRRCYTSLKKLVDSTQARTRT